MRNLLFVVVAIAGAGCERPTSPGVGMPPAMSRAEAPALSNPSAAAVEPRRPTPLPASVPSDALTDAAITARIRNELMADPGLAGADVSVHTNNGVVALSGTVRTPEQTAIASAHAQRQDGVMRVDNHLRPELS